MDTSKYRVSPKQPIELSKTDTVAPSSADKAKAKERVADIGPKLSELQWRLHADNDHKVLVVIQATDTGGKDGVVRNVFGALNPQGARFANFGAPTAPEQAHDFLWRIHAEVPGNGELVVFNRSHYEDVLIVRVHDLVPPSRWKKRYRHIVEFERMLVDEGTTIIKFFLHISKEQQAERLRARLDDPTKNWKFNEGDLTERKFWDDYQVAYEEMLNRTSTDDAPWYIVPADNKWFRDLVVSEVMLETLESLKLEYPKPIPNLADIVID